MENMDKGLTHWTKMGADSSAENTPNAPEFIFPICLPKPKSSGFQWKKASLGVCSRWLYVKQYNSENGFSVPLNFNLQFNV